MHPYLKNQNAIQDCHHFIAGEWTPGSKTETVVLDSPYTGKPMSRYHPADAKTVDQAIQKAKAASQKWGVTPIKERTQVLFRFRDELLRNLDEITATKSFESGKTIEEGRAGLMKGIEVLEFALSLQNLDHGGKLEVSRGVSCEYRRVPLGVVAGITPFNFPGMVPMWMIPNALVLGNAFVFKPSDKTPMTSLHLANCLKKAGLPDGIFTVLQGGKETAEAIVDHPHISAVGFVGSTPVAKSVYRQATQKLKRALTLGGAKNHILLLPDAHPEMAAQGIVDSFTGCCGQRCMASSVLLAIGNVDSVIEKIVERTKSKRPEKEIGAIITKKQLEFLHKSIDDAEKAGAKVLLDGRKVSVEEDYAGGNWLAPTILDGVSPQSTAAREELFGPVLSIIRVKDLSEALELDRQCEFGNATSVFTSNGGLAERVAQATPSGMVGVNIGVPVPREPFSFGGRKASKFGHGDMTGVHCLDFWSDVKKVTVKWDFHQDANWMS